ncbi:MAG: DsbE family thiol:disulfide interchange protein [Chloroflexota bacterium]|nr:DsbE family thiol:disulfide interchange protein [Chloroflexota bacterium]
MAAPAPRRSLLRWLAVPLVLVPLGWLLFTGLGRDPRVIPSPLVGQPLPAFAATTLEGSPFSSSQLARRPAIVNVWASWCTPCVDEHPLLLDLAARHASDLTVVGIVYQDTPEGARGFLARYGDGGWANLLDPAGRIGVDLGVTGPPETFFVDAKGIVRARQVGPLTAGVIAAELTRLGLTP